MIGARQEPGEEILPPGDTGRCLETSVGVATGGAP